MWWSVKKENLKKNRKHRMHDCMGTCDEYCTHRKALITLSASAVFSKGSWPVFMVIWAKKSVFSQPIIWRCLRFNEPRMALNHYTNFHLSTVMTRVRTFKWLSFKIKAHLSWWRWSLYSFFTCRRRSEPKFFHRFLRMCQKWSALGWFV